MHRNVTFEEPSDLCPNFKAGDAHVKAPFIPRSSHKISSEMPDALLKRKPKFRTFEMSPFEILGFVKARAFNVAEPTRPGSFATLFWNHQNWHSRGRCQKTPPTDPHLFSKHHGRYCTGVACKRILTLRFWKDTLKSKRVFKHMRSAAQEKFYFRKKKKTYWYIELSI